MHKPMHLDVHVRSPTVSTCLSCLCYH